MSDTSAFYAARDFMVAALKDELIGSAADDVVTETPMNRFVTGILYPQDPQRNSAEDVDEASSGPEADRQNPDSDDEGTDTFEAVDTPVSLSHVRYPSAFGLSFSVAEATTDLSVEVSAARYEDSGGKWNRRPVGPSAVAVSVASTGARRPISIASTLELHVVVREARSGTKPVTLALVNTAEAPARGLRDGYAWYQVELNVTCPDGFLDRPTHTSTGLEDDDVAANRLLFRNARNLAIGHGCAVEWTDADVVTELRMSFIPAHDVPRADTSIAGVPPLPMSAFADGQGFALLEQLIQRYRDWISAQRLRISELTNPGLVASAEQHLSRADTAANRIESGLQLLQSEPDVMRAFRLMNRAMREQRNRQEWIRSGAEPTEQYWRPFQIAFILMNLRGLADPGDPERDLADLLWFPTGGGKTEAYLGLIGFAILLRRIRNPRHGGVSVLMRYTLRLLTLQQFERAAGLICALERIRQSELPSSVEISLGLWVGQAATPNNLKDAKTALNKLKKGESLNENNPMQLTRCPWCGTDLSPNDYVIQQYPSAQMSIRCPTFTCDFHGGIPAHVVDSEVYAARPSLVIGTVDKFAMMAWRAEAQALFSVDGAHPKPDLIVQDELHLISGPLGTMVGLYETAVDAACTDDEAHRPKLIASTATIRRATAQMSSVFAREARQFPPPGLDADDSFFSKDADPATTGTRQYVGVMAQGVTHTYLMVRTYAALLQAAKDLVAPDEVRDAYWTLMGYFNSLRVLGGAAMQVTDDVVAQMHVIATRHGTEERDPGEPSELTSRIASSDIPERLKQLGWALGGDEEPLNVVLATNMISVGLDVDRLGLMAVMGQPQATAEYIQATSRVGRRNPGLVVVIYNSARSRDLSHYESFSTYHRALYRQVEPNSATPFSPRARDRGLHGCLVAYARNTEPTLAADTAAAMVSGAPTLLEPTLEGILERTRRVAPDEVDATETQLRLLVHEWQEAGADGHLKYPGWRDGTGALLVQAGLTLAGDDAPPPFPVDAAPWATLTSLRDVDAVSSFYFVSERGN